jgi:hypothetical protein
MAFLVGLSFLIVLSGVLIGFLESTGVPITGGNGVRTWQSTSFAQVRPAYRTEFGLSTLNLSAVNFPSSGFSVVDTLSVGRLEIVLPANAIVELKTHVGIGTISIENGPGGSPVAQFQPVPSTLHSAQSQSQAPHVTIDAEVGIGHILIVRALAK